MKAVLGSGNFRYILNSAIFVVLFVGIIFCGGCSLVNLNIGPSISAFKEKTLSGEGEDKILLIDLSGTITNFKKTTFLGGQTDVGMVERIRETLEKAEEDESIKALILRINSPGGTVTASDLIFHEISSFKKRKGIKVYALVMDMAASGGYYVAMAADHIVAHPTSLTGSIGVITIKVNLEGLMDKVGVDWEVVKSAKKKDFLSPFRALTEEERQLFQETIDSFHNRFVQIITDNRPKLKMDEVRKLADGRIYTSEQAIQAKLIDQVAYFDEAVEYFNKDLGTPNSKIVTYHRSGEYKTNLYSSLPKPTTINMVNFDFNFLPESPGPHFMYLWMP